MWTQVWIPKPELPSIYSEIRRELKPHGLNYFFGRNHDDQFYGVGVEVEEGIYDINGFGIRFFPEKELHDLLAKEVFKMLIRSKSSSSAILKDAIANYFHFKTFYQTWIEIIPSSIS